ncbi:hypothetical protein [Embleya sp. NBC_00896]|uniref:hypothetical protein n=1 Tax=Embleya sp. NBC_00896 TaxID=2975961 RepID=UPI0038696411|nr:hypothetical protein OG928_45190 [Embleya sp. NBC_00896]
MSSRVNSWLGPSTNSKVLAREFEDAFASVLPQPIEVDFGGVHYNPARVFGRGLLMSAMCFPGMALNRFAGCDLGAPEATPEGQNWTLGRYDPADGTVYMNERYFGTRSWDQAQNQQTPRTPLQARLGGPSPAAYGAHEGGHAAAHGALPGWEWGGSLAERETNLGEDLLLLCDPRGGPPPRQLVAAAGEYAASTPPETIAELSADVVMNADRAHRFSAGVFSRLRLAQGLDERGTLGMAPNLAAARHPGPSREFSFGGALGTQGKVHQWSELLPGWERWKASGVDARPAAAGFEPFTLQYVGKDGRVLPPGRDDVSAQRGPLRGALSHMVTGRRDRGTAVDRW